MEDRFHLYATGQVGFEDGGQQLDRNLRQALRPARLLYLKAVHLNRQFRRALDTGNVDELPALQSGRDS